MSYPPRLAHLATYRVVASKLVPTYAEAHRLDEDEARERLEAAIKGPLLDQLLQQTWDSLMEGTKRLTDEGMLEKIAQSLKDRPMRAGKVAKLTPGWSAFLILADIEAGTATDAARRVLESPEGHERAVQGMKEVGAFLAKELTRK